MKPHPRIPRSFAAAGLAISLASPLFAETLAQWDFAGMNGDQPDALAVETSIPAGLTVSPITRGDGFHAAKPSPFTQDSFSIRVTPTALTLVDATEQQAYFEVTFTPAAGKKLSIERVVFSSKRATKKSGPLFVVVRSSIDDYSSDISGPFDPLPVNLPEGGDMEFTFSGALNDLTDPVTLRFYAYGRDDPQNPSAGLWVIGNNSATGGFTIEGTLR